MGSKNKKSAPKKGTDKKKAPKTKSAPKAAKKEVKAKLTEIEVTYGKAKPELSINPSTGSRFKHGTAGQAALELVIENAGSKTLKEVGELANTMKKENGKEFKFNLNSGYITFAVASHPEFFKCMSDGTYTLKKKFKADKKAAEEAVRLQNEREERKANKKPAAKKSSKKSSKKETSSKKTKSKTAAPKKASTKKAPPKKLKKPSKAKA